MYRSAAKNRAKDPEIGREIRREATLRGIGIMFAQRTPRHARGRSSAAAT
jgi:hypothetical protein